MLRTPAHQHLPTLLGGSAQRGSLRVLPHKLKLPAVLEGDGVAGDHPRVGDLGDAPARRGAAGGVGTVVAPMPGQIVRVLVAVGDAVEAGAPLIVLEAMKMETTLRSEIAGTVAAVPVEAGATVDAGAVLVEVAEAAAN